MKKLWATLFACLSLFVAVEAVEMAPASADSVCHIGSPQINNSFVCAKAWVSLRSDGYYNAHVSLQVKSVGWSAKTWFQVSPGTWVGSCGNAFYDAMGWGVGGSWCGPVNRPNRVKIVMVNSFTGQQTSYSWAL